MVKMVVRLLPTMKWNFDIRKVPNFVYPGRRCKRMIFWKPRKLKKGLPKYNISGNFGTVGREIYSHEVQDDLGMERYLLKQWIFPTGSITGM